MFKTILLMLAASRIRQDTRKDWNVLKKVMRYPFTFSAGDVVTLCTMQSLFCSYSGYDVSVWDASVYKLGPQRPSEF